MKLKIFFLTLFSFLLVPLSVNASGSFSVRLGQPKTPTNQNNFKLTFVALDTRTDRNITVRCFKQGPTESSFTQFDTDKVLIPGGNTDSCEVTPSILTTQGTYSFYVEGITGTENIPSSTVTVDYNTSGPSTPVSYSKEKVNSCDYKIKFKTANDGKTAKVQLFRSDNLSIPVSASTVISGLNIGPDTEGEIINSVPTCGKDYYFVIRALDSSDNASGVIGDSFTTTTTVNETTTTSTGTTGGSTGGAIAGDGSSSQVTAPGDATPSGDSTNGESVTETPSPSPTILGASTETKRNFTKWLLLLIAAFIGYFAFRVVRASKSK